MAFKKTLKCYILFWLEFMTLSLDRYKLNSFFVQYKAQEPLQLQCYWMGLLQRGKEMYKKCILWGYAWHIAVDPKIEKFNDYSDRPLIPFKTSFFLHIYYKFMIFGQRLIPFSENMFHISNYHHHCCFHSYVTADMFIGLLTEASSSVIKDFFFLSSRF